MRDPQADKSVLRIVHTCPRTPTKREAEKNIQKMKKKDKKINVSCCVREFLGLSLYKTKEHTSVGAELTHHCQRCDRPVDLNLSCYSTETLYIYIYFHCYLSFVPIFEKCILSSWNMPPLWYSKITFYWSTLSTFFITSLTLVPILRRSISFLYLTTSQILLCGVQHIHV